jgi:hypothetical protein
MLVFLLLFTFFDNGLNCRFLEGLFPEHGLHHLFYF